MSRAQPSASAHNSQLCGPTMMMRLRATPGLAGRIPRLASLGAAGIAAGCGDTASVRVGQTGLTCTARLSPSGPSQSQAASSSSSAHPPQESGRQHDLSAPADLRGLVAELQAGIRLLQRQVTSSTIAATQCRAELSKLQASVREMRHPRATTMGDPQHLHQSSGEFSGCSTLQELTSLLEAAARSTATPTSDTTVSEAVWKLSSLVVEDTTVIPRRELKLGGIQSVQFSSHPPPVGRAKRRDIGNENGCRAEVSAKRAFVHLLDKRLSSIPPLGGIEVVEAVAVMRWSAFPGPLLTKLLHQRLGDLANLPAHRLVDLAAALGGLRRCHPGVMDTLADAVAPRVAELDCHGLAQLAHAYATLHHDAPHVLQEVAATAMERSWAGHHEDLVNLAWSLAFMKELTPELYRKTMKCLGSEKDLTAEQSALHIRNLLRRLFQAHLLYWNWMGRNQDVRSEFMASRLGAAAWDAWVEDLATAHAGQQGTTRAKFMQSVDDALRDLQASYRREFRSGDLWIDFEVSVPSSEEAAVLLVIGPSQGLNVTTGKRHRMVGGAWARKELLEGAGHRVVMIPWSRFKSRDVLIQFLESKLLHPAADSSETAESIQLDESAAMGSETMGADGPCLDSSDGEGTEEEEEEEMALGTGADKADISSTLERLTKAELQAALRSRGLPVSGRKTELAKRLAGGQ